MALTFVEKEVNGVIVVQVSGRVTLGDESNQLRTKLKDILSQGKTRIVLDLAEVSYIDSAGLGTLVAGFTSARNQGANLKLANLTKRFREQLNITKLVTIFDVYENVQDAVKSTEPIEIMVEDGEFYKTFRVDYHGGEKYPSLVRDESLPDLLSAITAPHAK